MKALLSRLTKSALDLLFPLNCVGCNKEGRFICSDCAGELPRLTRPYCEICAQPGAAGACHWCQQAEPAFEGVRAPFLMKGTVRNAVHSLKYRGVRAAAPELAGMLAQHLASNPMPGNTLVPVPLHPRRLRRRGYNQAALLAHEIAKLTELQVDEGLLARTKDAPPQVAATSRAQRRANVEGSFQCVGSTVGLRVILIDDVATTGSTLSSCAAELRDAGADSVWGLALAREG